MTICYQNLLNQYFEDLDLTASQGEVLLYLYQSSSDTVRTSDLLQVFQIAPASLSGVLKKLNQKGYIVYAREQKDTRKKAISLTEKAFCAQTRLEQRMKDFETLIFQQIEDSDCIITRQTLEVILQNITSYRSTLAKE